MSDHATSFFKQLKPQAMLFFIGIGGISMSGLAEMAYRLGYRVTGSDRQANEHTQHLNQLGIHTFEGHSSNHIDETHPDLIIYTAAVHPDNPERVQAEMKGIHCIERSTFLGWITEAFPQVINVAGTHGKTTTTAMVARILQAEGLDPTVHIGAELEAFHHSPIHLGEKRNLFVSEACEYHNSFHAFLSTTAIINNIESDHMDFFKDIDDLVRSFAIFTDKLADDGWLILPQWGKHMLHLYTEIAKRRQANHRPMPRIITFGQTAPEAACYQRYITDLKRYPEAAAKWPTRPTVRYDNLTFIHGLPAFDVTIKDKPFIHLKLQVPGQHNVDNAVASIAAAYFNGANAEACHSILSRFTGAEGRYTIKGTYRGATVVSDYAHHPSATKATLAAAEKMPHRHIWVVYQPLTYNRVKLFFDKYVDVLKDYPHTIFYEIYSDREKYDYGMSSKLICDEINKKGGSAEFATSYKDVVKKLNRHVGPQDIILFLGPEQVRQFADKLVLEADGVKAPERVQ